MKKIELRPLGIAAILLLCAVACQNKKQKEMNCHFKVEKPYSLIQFADSSYGILFYDLGNWFKCNPRSGHDFSIVRNDALHFTDSCEAKEALIIFLKQQGKLEFKVVSQ